MKASSILCISGAVLKGGLAQARQCLREKTMRTIALSLMLCVSSAAQQPVTCLGPLSEAQLIDLVRSHVPEERLRLLVNTCGVEFTWSGLVAARLRAAGVSPELLAEIKSPSAKSAPAPATPAPTPATDVQSADSAPSLMNPASLDAQAPNLFRVEFATTHGYFVVDVYRDWAPLGADRFYNLVKAQFFTDNAFYRYSPGFVVQFGVSANPAVTKAWANARIKDDPVTESNKKGTLTFATSGPNSRTNDFFINLKDNAPLDELGFVPLGSVTEGMDVVEGLYSGYGEMKEMSGKGPSQTLLMNQGKPYLDQNFPNLDYIKSATVIFP